MATLEEILLTDEKRPAVVSDCVQMIEEEVRSKKGMTGLAVKAAFKVVKTVKRGIIRESVEGLLDEFVGRIEPFYADFHDQGGGSSVSTYIESRGDEVANALLGVTDDRARRASNRTMKKAYEKLRPAAKKHVEAAVPRVGRMLERNGA